MDKKGGYHDFPWKSFVSECRKNSRGKISVLRFTKFPLAKNSVDKRGGYQVFPSKVFCTAMPITLAGEPFCVVFQKTSGSEKDYA